MDKITLIFVNDKDTDKKVRFSPRDGEDYRVTGSLYVIKSMGEIPFKLKVEISEADPDE